MGFRESQKLKQRSAAPSVEAESYDGQRWEYRARNLKKVAGMGLERDFNEHGAAGMGVLRRGRRLRHLQEGDPADEGLGVH